MGLGFGGLGGLVVVFVAGVGGGFRLGAALK
jgi:hypothetical protein